MSEHVALFVDRLVQASTGGNADPSLSIALGRASFAAKKASLTNGKQLTRPKSSCSIHNKDEGGMQRIGSKSSNFESGEEVLEHSVAEKIAVECRICQEEDDVLNLEAPCACKGSLKFVHRKCAQHWCDEKGDTICEICCQPFAGGYTAPLSSVQPDSFSISIRRSWEVGGERRMNAQGSRLLPVASEDVLLDSNYEDYARANAQTAACFRSVAFVLMVFLLLRHILSMTSPVAEEDISTFIMLFFLRAMGFFLPCYVMARALSMLHSRRQRQEAALESSEVAYLLQNRQAHAVTVAGDLAE